MAGQNIILVLLIGQTILVTVQMYADLSLYYSDVDEYDLIQTFQPELHLAFLVELKNSKSWGKCYGVSCMSKFYDAIKLVSVLANQHLSTNLYFKLDTFFAAYKKEFAHHKKKV